MTTISERSSAHSLPFVTNARLRWDELTLGPQRREPRRPKRVREINAVDTETIRGKLWLIAEGNGTSVFPVSFGDVIGFCREAGLHRTTNFCYNLDYDVRAMLTLLPRGVLEELHLLGKVLLGDGELVYIPSKIFVVRLGHHRYEFFDLAQFFYASLENASAKYLGKHKLGLDAKRISDDAEYRREHLNEIVEYCVQDATLTKELGQYTANTFSHIGVTTNKWYSAGFLSESYFRDNATIPRYHLKSVEEYAYYSYAGGRFEVFKRGHFDELNKYDIKSAYPYVISTLPDLDNGKWVSLGHIDYDADLIYVKCRVTVRDRYVQPFHVKVGGLVVFPTVGPHIRILTKSELELADRLDNVDVQVLDGWHFYANDSARPFAKIRDLYARRQEMKRAGDTREWVLKIVMNSLYGKFIQVTSRYDKVLTYNTGNLFLPCYASEITARTRTALVNTLLDHDIAPTALFTDAILTEDTGIPVGDALGCWTLESRGEAVILGAGVYSIRTDDDTDTHLRGFTHKSKDSLFDMLERNRSHSHIPFCLERPVTLGEFVRHTHKYIAGDLNRFVQRDRDLSINFDHKRIWAGDLASCAEALRVVQDSAPLVLA